MTICCAWSPWHGRRYARNGAVYGIHAPRVPSGPRVDVGATGAQHGGMGSGYAHNVRAPAPGTTLTGRSMVGSEGPPPESGRNR